MLKNYFITACRNLRKHKTYAFINVFGLSLAFVCSLFLFMNVAHDLSYDQFHEEKETIFKVYHYRKTIEEEKFGTSMSYPVAPTLKAEIPEVKAATRYLWSGGGLEYKGKQFDLQTNLVDNDFFKMFSFPVIKGNTGTPLPDVGSVALSRSAAGTIFGEENPIGKLIRVKLGPDWKELSVSAVLEDTPNNSSVTFAVLARPELNGDYEVNKNNWSWQHHDVFIKIAPTASPEQVEEKMRRITETYNAVDSVYMKKNGYLRDAKGDYFSMRLLPLTEIHLNEEIGSGNNKVSYSYVYTLLLIGIFILAIACFNFINLTIAQSFTRVKEVGVRKYLGAEKKQIFLQVWGESLLLCLLALMIGLGCSVSLFTWLSREFGSKFSLGQFISPLTIMAMLAGTLVVSLIAGGYPALVISKLNATNILKGSITLKKPGIFRNSLIIVQFSMACLLMGCTVIAYKQFEYMRSMPLGINKQAVITIPLYNYGKGADIAQQFRLRLASQPAVLSVSGSNINIGVGKDGSTSKRSTGFAYKDLNINANMLTVDYDFLKTLGITLLRGRDFSRSFATDTVTSVIVTQSMASQFGVKDPVGLSFVADSALPPSVIIGVIPDFHLYSLHEKTEPLMIDMSSAGRIDYVFIKIKTEEPLQLMETVKAIYKDLEPGREFRGTFMDENTERWYSKEKNLSRLLGVASLIAIVLSCLGLFALALLMIGQRVKEIGVRKVLGASAMNINLLLTKEFLRLVVLSIVIATPLAWWLMSQWLQNFPYRMTISWTLFLIVGITAVLVAVLTVGFHTLKAAMANPVKSLRTE